MIVKMLIKFLLRQSVIEIPVQAQSRLIIVTGLNYAI
jgi:hypothetical protein